MTVEGIVSDTHLPRFGRALPRALERGLRRAHVDRILHLGDLTDPLAVPLFEAIASVRHGRRTPEYSPSQKIR